MRIEVLTIFPRLFEFSFEEGIVQQAIKKGLVEIRITDLRDFTTDRHRTVDDRPFGGGEGMVLKPDVVARALESVPADPGQPGLAKVCLTPRGLPVSQKDIKRFASGPGIVLLCGRFEGIDQRVVEAKGLEEVSLGDIVLSSGEPAALALIDACVRLLPGVMGNDQGVVNESFEGELLEHPHYTRPPMWEGIEVPQVLVSGNHKEIDIWRRQEAEIATRKRRPDMWARYNSLGSVRKLTNR